MPQLYVNSTLSRTGAYCDLNRSSITLLINQLEVYDRIRKHGSADGQRILTLLLAHESFHAFQRQRFGMFYFMRERLPYLATALTFWLWIHGLVLLYLWQRHWYGLCAILLLAATKVIIQGTMQLGMWLYKRFGAYSSPSERHARHYARLAIADPNWQGIGKIELADQENADRRRWLEGCRKKLRPLRPLIQQS